MPAKKTEDFSSDWTSFTEAFLSHGSRTPSALARLIDGHTAEPMGPIAKGYLLLMLARAELRPAAQEAYAEAIRRGALLGDDRTRNLASGLRHWLDGKPTLAVGRIEAVIAHHPQDAFAVKLSHAIRFMLGDADGMRRSLARVVSIYTPDVPFAGYIKGCYAFALEETGDYREAERMGRRAIALQPQDAWGRHAVAHVLEMTGRATDGLSWLEDAATWSHCNNFGFHMLWHRGLFLLELGRTAEALALYDTAMRAEQTDDFRDIANAASLLQRLELLGVDAGQRWEELADKAERRIGDRQLAFADLHYILALVGADRLPAARQLAEGLLKTDGGDDAAIAHAVAAPAAEALIAFSTGQFAAAAMLLDPIMPVLQHIGGSHAQRDVFVQIWLESLVRSGHPLAEGHLSARRRGRNGRNAFAASRLTEIANRRSAMAAAALALTPQPQLH